MEARVYNLCGEMFYVSWPPNGYFLVTRGCPVGSAEMEIVGYFGPRFYGGDADPYGWATKLKPRWDVHLSGDDDQLGCAGESLSSVLGE